jgi:hypothetical protein
MARVQGAAPQRPPATGADTTITHHSVLNASRARCKPAFNKKLRTKSSTGTGSVTVSGAPGRLRLPPCPTLAAPVWVLPADAKVARAVGPPAPPRGPDLRKGALRLANGSSEGSSSSSSEGTSTSAYWKSSSLSDSSTRSSATTDAIQRDKWKIYRSARVEQASRVGVRGGGRGRDRVG